MTHAPEKAESRWAELSDEVLESVDAGRRAAIEAMRKFVSTIETATAQHGDPGRRRTVIDAVLNFAGELSATQMELLHSVTRIHYRGHRLYVRVSGKGAEISMDPRDLPPIEIECRGRVERLQPGNTIRFV